MNTEVNMKRTSSVLVLAESGLCIALATVLSLFPLFSWPWGGSVTFCATLPIIVIGLRHGVKWGMVGALCFSVIQLLLGMENFSYLPQTVWTLALCALLDYILAYTVLGFAGPIARRFKKPGVGIIAGIVITGLARLACSFLSGVLLWGSYAWEGWPVAGYSLVYNAAWCLPDVTITLIACLLLAKVRASKLFLPNKSEFESAE